MNQLRHRAIPSSCFYVRVLFIFEKSPHSVATASIYSLLLISSVISNEQIHKFILLFASSYNSLKVMLTAAHNKTQAKPLLNNSSPSYCPNQNFTFNWKVNWTFSKSHLSLYHQSATYFPFH